MLYSQCHKSLLNSDWLKSYPIVNSDLLPSFHLLADIESSCVCAVMTTYSTQYFARLWLGSIQLNSLAPTNGPNRKDFVERTLDLSKHKSQRLFYISFSLCKKTLTKTIKNLDLLCHILISIFFNVCKFSRFLLTQLPG